MTTVTKRNVAELNLDAPLDTSYSVSRHIENAAVFSVFARLQSKGLIDANAKLDGSLPDNAKGLFGFGHTQSPIGKEIKRRMEILGLDINKAPTTWESALTVLLTDVDHDKKLDLDLDILRKSGLLKKGTTNTQIQAALTGAAPQADDYIKARLTPSTWDVTFARALTFHCEQTTNELNKGAHRNEANLDVDVIADNIPHLTQQQLDYQATIKHFKDALVKLPAGVLKNELSKLLDRAAHGEHITDAQFKDMNAKLSDFNKSKAGQKL